MKQYQFLLSPLALGLGLTALPLALPGLAQQSVALAAPAAEPSAPKTSGYGTGYGIAAAAEPGEPAPTPNRGYGRAIALDGGGGGSTRMSSKRDSIAPVVVDFTSKDPALLQEMEEDLLVMSHILDQALEHGVGELAPPTKMGVPMVYTTGGRSTRGLYLDSFGALFMLKVNMPLLPPPAAKQAESTPPVDSEWESARREVLGSESALESLSVSGTGGEAPFDQEQFDTLKRTLIDSFKNAGNIRHLKPDDYVSIAVFGQPAAQVSTVELSLNDDLTSEKGGKSSGNSGNSSSSSKAGKSSKRSTNSATTNFKFSPTKTANIASMKGTVLTLRAKKADIAAYSAGQINAEEFTKRVNSNAYPGSGYGILSVNSWIQSGRTAPNIRY